MSFIYFSICKTIEGARVCYNVWEYRDAECEIMNEVKGEGLVIFGAYEDEDGERGMIRYEGNEWVDEDGVCILRYY